MCSFKRRLTPGNVVTTRARALQWKTEFRFRSERGAKGSALALRFNGLWENAQRVDYAAVVGDAPRLVVSSEKGSKGERWKAKIEIKTKRESRTKAVVVGRAEIAPS